MIHKKNVSRLAAAIILGSAALSAQAMNVGNVTQLQAAINNTTDPAVNITNNFTINANLSPNTFTTGKNFTGNGFTITLGSGAARRLNFSGAGQNSTFDNITLTGGVNAAIVSTDQHITISNSTLVLNSNAGSNGGAISNGGVGVLTINSTLFDRNTAGSGGAIVNNSNATLNINDGTSFTTNTSTGAGGAIRNQGTALIKGTTAPVTFSSNSSGVNGGGAIFSNNSLTIEGLVDFTSNTSAGQGGAIFNNGGTLNINGTNGDINFTGNTAGAAGGGAISNSTGPLTITGDVLFESNTATGNAGGAINTSGTTTINQGAVFRSNIAGTNGGAIQCSSSILNIDGVQFITNTANGSSGAIHVSSGSAAATIGNSLFQDNIANGVGVGDQGGGAIFNSNGSVTLTPGNIFDGNSSSTNGGAIQNNGSSAVLTIQDGNTFKDNTTTGNGGAIYNHGNVGSGATVNISGNNTFTNNTAGAQGGAIYAEGNVNLTPGAGNIISFDDNNQGSGKNDIFVATARTLTINGTGGTVYIGSGLASGAATSVVNDTTGNELILGENSLNNAFSGTYNKTGGTLTNYSTSFLGGTNNISNSDVNLLQAGDMTINNLSLASSNVNTVNDLITTTTVNAFTGSGTNNFAVDINGGAQTADSFVFTGNATGTFNISSINLLGTPTAEVIPLQIFTVTGTQPTYSQSISQPITTPIYNYGFRSDGAGQYSLFQNSFNPQIFRGQVATLAAYQNQLVVNNVLFDHVYLDSNELVAKNQMNNRYAAAYPQFAPYQFVSEGGSIWFKTYATFERLSMTQGLNVNNNAYGTIVGADFDTINLGDGWKFLPTAFIAYNGGHQTYNGVSNYQNGGQGGFMGTFSKGDYIGSILAYGGGYNNEMSVGGFNDNVGNWFAGAAIKQAYNFHPTKNFIIQPNALVSYNIFGKQNWGTDFGALSMNSGLLNGINVAPGINLIYGRETWSVYFTAMYMYNINDNVNGSAGPVNLPSVSMRHGYIEYGIGATKTWKERLMGYCQFVIRNGGRLGIGLQAGLSWKF